MRTLSAEDEAALRAIAARHSFYAARGPHTGEGSASRLIDALLTGEVVTLALTPADRRRLVAWLDEAPPPEGRLTTVLQSVAAQLRPTLPKATTAAVPHASTTAAAATATTAPPPRHRRGYLTTDEAARRLDLSPARAGTGPRRRDRPQGRRPLGLHRARDRPRTGRARPPHAAALPHAYTHTEAAPAPPAVLLRL